MLTAIARAPRKRRPVDRSEFLVVERLRTQAEVPNIRVAAENIRRDAERPEPRGTVPRTVR